MGIWPGEKIKRISLIEIISTGKEPLNAITHDDCRRDDCRRDGFPDFYPVDFVGMLSRHYQCVDDEPVNRIEFRHI